MARKRQRGVSQRKGPRQKPKPPTNPGPGKRFDKGQNSHDNTTFRRGPDRIGRGTIELLYRTVKDDDGDLCEELFAPGLEGKILPWRHAMARSLILAANDPSKAPAVAEVIACRLEGRPIQKFEAGAGTFAVFYQQGDPPPWLPQKPVDPVPAAAPPPANETKK